MRTLIAFEFKKLLGRKVLWAALALVLAFLCYDMNRYVKYELSGYTQGLRDGVAPFEGQVLTDAVANQARAMLMRYVEAHPDEFQYYDTEGEDPIPFAIGWYNYANGLWKSCMNIAQGYTLEQRQENTIGIQVYLDNGVSGDGRKLTQEDRRMYLRQIEDNSHPEVVHYAAGWEELYVATQSDGLFLFLLLVVGLTALFGAERAARMDNVLLCARARRRVIGAKMVVSAVYTLSLCALLYGLRFAVIALTMGLDGGQYPIRELGNWLNIAPDSMTYSVLPVSAPYLPALALTALAAVACAGLIALASSLFRHPLATLGMATAVLMVQFLPVTLARTDLDIQATWLPGVGATILQKIAVLLPAYQMNSLSNVTALTESTTALALCAGLSAAVAVAAAIATPAVFCRRRKA